MIMKPIGQMTMTALHIVHMANKQTLRVLSLYKSNCIFLYHTFIFIFIYISAIAKS